MTAIQKSKEWMVCHTHIAAFLLIVIQPVMDVISYWCTEFQVAEALTLLMRLAVFAAAGLWGFCISDSKKIYWITAGVLVFLYAGHTISCLQVGFADPVGDFANFVRVAQMPVLVIVLASCLKKNDKTFRALLLGAATALLIILAIEALSVATGTDPHTYEDGTGVLGWFYNTNSQSAILGMLAPFLMLCAYRSRRAAPLLFAAATILSCTALFFLGTRLAYASIFGVCLAFSFTLLLLDRKKIFFILLPLLCALVFGCLYKVSPMYMHQNAYEKAQNDRQEETDDEIKDAVPEVDEDKESLEEELSPEEYHALVERLTPTYEKYLGDLVRIFGAEKTMKMYNFSTDSFDFSNVRQKKLLFSRALLSESPATAYVFGMELSRFTVGENIYDVENDFHGIFFLYGGAGLAAYAAFLLYFLHLIGWALWKNARRYFTPEAAVCGVSLLICLAHAYNTAGVLRRPNASVYLSLVLALIYFLVRIRTYPEDKKSEEA